MDHHMHDEESHPSPFAAFYNRSAQARLKILSLLKEEKFADFKIISQGQFIRCHRAIISSTCDYFATLLDSGLKESTQCEVVMDTIEFDIIKDIIYYLYGEKVMFCWEKIKVYFDACESLQLMDLKKELEEYAEKYIVAKNCIGWFKFADRYNLNSISKTARNIMITQLNLVSTYEEFKDLSLAEVRDYLTDDELNVEHYDDVIMAALQWIAFDSSSRKESLHDMMSNVNFERCSPECLRQVMKNYVDDARVLKVICDTCLDRIGPHQAYTQGEKLVVLGGMDKYDGTKNRQCWTLSEKGLMTFETFVEIPDRFIGKQSSIVCIPCGFVVLNTRNNVNMKYDMKLKEWIHMPESPKNELFNSSSVYCSGSIFVLGGTDLSDQLYDSVLHLDLSKNEWHNDPDMLERQRWPIVCSVGKSIYVAFNHNSGEKVPSTLQQHIIGSEGWKYRSSLPCDMKTTGASMVSNKESLYLVGGKYKICLTYDTKMDTWTRLDVPHLVHAFGSALFYKGQLILCGGHADGVSHNHIEQYDTEDKKWSELDLKLPKNLRYITLDKLQF